MSFSVRMTLRFDDLMCGFGFRLLCRENAVTDGISQLIRADAALVFEFFLSVDSSVAYTEDINFIGWGQPFSTGLLLMNADGLLITASTTRL